MLLAAGLAAAMAVSLIAAPGLEGLLGALLAAAMLAIARVDATRFRIPNELTAAAGALALVRAGLTGDAPGLDAMLWTAASAIVTAAPFLLLLLVYRWFRGRDGLGLGDVKLAAVAGAWLDVAVLFAVIEGAALAAIAAYVIAALRNGRRFDTAAALPFGVFLAPAIWIGWLAGQWLQ